MFHGSKIIIFCNNRKEKGGDTISASKKEIKYFGWCQESRQRGTIPNEENDEDRAQEGDIEIGGGCNRVRAIH